MKQSATKKRVESPKITKQSEKVKIKCKSIMILLPSMWNSSGGLMCLNIEWDHTHFRIQLRTVHEIHQLHAKKS